MDKFFESAFDSVKSSFDSFSTSFTEFTDTLSETFTPNFQGNKDTHVTVTKQTHLMGVDTKLGNYSGDSLLIHDSDALQQLESLQLEENSENDGMKSMGNSDGRVDFIILSDEELVKTCADVVYVFYNDRYCTSGEGKTVEPYMTELFKRVPSDKYTTLCGEAKAEATKETELTLSCMVVRAGGLIVKDSKSLCDPFCVMGLLHQSHLDDKLVKKGNLLKWKEHGLVKSLVQSTARERTLDPVWEERFELTVKNPSEEYLVVEVWNDDSASKGKRKAKAFSGLATLLKVKNDDDCMGRAFFLLKNTSTASSCHTLELTSHSAQKKRGNVTVQLEIRGAKVDKVSKKDLHDEHKRLVVAIYSHESYKDDSFVKRWDGVLSDPAVSLLSHHAASCCISALQQTTTQISVLMDYHRSYAVEMSAFRQQLVVVKKHDKELNKLRIQAGDHPESDHYWVSELFVQLKMLATYIIDLIKSHLEVFDIKSKIGIERLSNHLLTIKDLYSISSFVAQLPEDQKDYHSVLSSCIQLCVPQWFLATTANNIPGDLDEETKILSFKALCNHCLNQCTRAQKNIDPVFQEVGVDYFSIFFISFDKLFYAEADRALNVQSDKLLLTMFELYKIFQCFMPLAEKVSKSWLQQQHTELHILNHHALFRSYVSQWTLIALARAKERILKAIEIDKVVKVTDQVPFSSSVVDANTTFLQVISFWKDLNWPDREQSHAWFVIVVKGLCDLAMFYTEVLHQKLQDEDLTDTDAGKFKITDKLCVTLNNIQHMREVLGKIHEEMDLPGYYRWLDEAESAHDPAEEQGSKKPSLARSLSKRSDTLLSDLVSSVQEDIEYKLQEMVDNIRTRLSPGIIKRFPDFSEKKLSEEAVLKMVDYMKVNLQQLGTGLLSQVFWNVLSDLWKEVLDALNTQYQQIPHTPSMRHCYANLFEVTLILRDFFHSGGGGLTGDQLQTEQYLTLIEKVRLGKSSTEQVIRRFCCDLVQQQEEAEKRFGMINLSHCFSNSTKKLTVFLANAVNIPELDKDSSTDPFIEATVLPSQIKGRSQKSSVQKSTLDPVFNQELKINVPKDELRQQGTVILLALFYHDTFGASDFAGLCVIQGSSVPIVEEAERKTEHLNFFHFKESRAFYELTFRSEASAVTFCKFMRRFQPQSPSAVRSMNAVFSVLKTDLENLIS